MSICQIYDLCAETLWLGRYGENGARDIAIDVGRWFADLGTEGTVVLVNWRPGEDDTPYNPNVTMDGSKVVWSPSNVDLAISGRGFAELRYYVGNSLAKSKTFRTVIDRTPSEGANPPSAAEDWVERMEQAAVTAQNAAEDAEDAAETATEGAQAVAAALPTVTQAAQTATTAAATATNAATEAAASEEVASAAANAAQTASESATAASQTAVNSATTATTKAAQAVEAAGTATTKASEATQAATTATANAQTSTAKAGEATTAATTATSKATEATTAASTASAAATTATGAASTATSAASTATAAKTAAQTAQTGAETAQTAAESAAASVSASAEQIETNKQDITELKADFSELPTDGVTANAKQLLSENGTDNTEPYLFRAVPVNADREEVNAVVGGSVAWNQYVNSGNYTASETLNGITFTNNADGSITANGTASTTAVHELGNILYSAFIVGHKYLVLTGFTDRGSNTTYEFMVLNSIGSGYAWNAYADGIFTVDSIAPNSKPSRFVVRSGVTVNNLKLTPQIIDLTQMFGSTIADYIYSLETATPGAGVAFFRKYYPADYYPFDAGTLKSVEGVSAKVTRDADNNVLGTYPLDSSLALRGIPKLADGKLYYDGDRYLPDGTVERNYGIRAYQLGDENLANAITDGTNTVYKLTASTTETATPYQSLQVCDPNGTEEFVSTGIIPVGHETFYPENLRAKIEGLPWDFSALIAPTETGTASRNYTTGALLIMNNVLYKVTANIANGGAITPGTNVTATTLSEVISALQ